MKYRQMGKTGLRVSERCLGTMTFSQTIAGVDPTTWRGKLLEG